MMDVSVPEVVGVVEEVDGIASPKTLREVRALMHPLQTQVALRSVQ